MSLTRPDGEDGERNADRWQARHDEAHGEVARLLDSRLLDSRFLIYMSCCAACILVMEIVALVACIAPLAGSRVARIVFDFTVPWAIVCLPSLAIAARRILLARRALVRIVSLYAEDRANGDSGPT